MSVRKGVLFNRCSTSNRAGNTAGARRGIELIFDTFFLWECAVAVDTVICFEGTYSTFMENPPLHLPPLSTTVQKYAAKRIQIQSEKVTITAISIILLQSVTFAISCLSRVKSSRCFPPTSFFFWFRLIPCKVPASHYPLPASLHRLWYLYSDSKFQSRKTTNNDNNNKLMELTEKKKKTRHKE